LALQIVVDKEVRDVVLVVGVLVGLAVGLAVGHMILVVVTFVMIFKFLILVVGAALLIVHTGMNVLVVASW
jgi:hypothetical protein